MWFFNNQEGIMGGYGGKMEKTNDGGSTWVTINFSSNYSFYSLQFTDSIHGFASASLDTILITNDAGINWEIRNNPANQIFFIDSLNGVSFGDYYLYTTNDGVVSWTEKTSNSYLKGVWFFDPLNGLAVCGNGNIRKTTDGALSWTPIPSPTTNGLSKIIFINSDTGFILGNNCILKTIDKGENWQYYETNPEILYKTSLSFRNQVEGFISIGAGFLKTTNCGDAWNISNTSILEDLTKIQFPDPKHGYVNGSFNFYTGKAFKTEDYGKTWDTLFTPRKTCDVFFTDSLHGYASSDSGYIMKTIDGGINWTITSTGINEYITSLYFTTPDTGFFGSKGIIGRTTDAGITWSLTYGLSSLYFESFSFPTKNTGFTYSPVYKTTDGGSTWFMPNSLYGGYGLDFPDSLHGYLASHEAILKSDDGGNTWQPVTSPLFDYSAVKFINKDSGYVLSWYGVYRTEDGGNTFEDVTPGNCMYYNLFFSDFDTGYLVGSGGSIIKTTNGSTLVGMKTIPLVQNKKLVVFPNPAKEKVTIRVDNPNGINLIEIYDLAGRKVDSEIFLYPQKEQIINTASLQKGCYIILVKTPSETRSQKLIIDK